jgi:hypothetical protein
MELSMTLPTEWERVTGRGPGLYGAEAKCYQYAVFCGAERVGQVLVGVPTYGFPHAEFGRFGLHLRYRKIKEYRPKPKSQKDRSERREVTTQEFDLEGNLVRLEKERRLVYFNTRGAYIKTRGAGRVYISDPETTTIIYRMKVVDVRVYDRHLDRYVTRQAKRLFTEGQPK